MEMIEMLYPDIVLRSEEAPHEVPRTPDQNIISSQAFNSKSLSTYEYSRHSPISATNVGCTDRLVGVDELLANVYHKVDRCSELPQLVAAAECLEQLENVVEAKVPQISTGVCHFSTTTVHCTPTDLAGWVESMLEELTPAHSTRNITHEHLQKTINYPGMAVSTESALIGSDVSIGSSAIANLQLRAGAIGSHSVTGREFSHKIVEAPATISSRFKDRSCGGIFGSIYSAEQLGLDQCIITRSASKRDPQQVFPARPHLQREKLDVNHLEVRNFGSMQPGKFYNNHDSEGSDIISSLYNRQDELIRGDSGQQSQLSACAIEHQLGSDNAQESGLRLVHLLVACAVSIEKDDLVAAEKLVREILACAELESCGPMKRVATQFAEALTGRIYGLITPQSIQCNEKHFVSDDVALLHYYFYETCPFMKFAHFTANLAILEAFENHSQVHVIDFNLMHGLQWPALIQALALRPGGPPFLRITGIHVLPKAAGSNNTSLQEEVGMRLAQLAKSVKVNLDFRVVMVRKLDDIKPWMLQVSKEEAIAVNSILQLHRLLYTEDPLQVSPPILEVLKTVRRLNPRIVTVVEQEANHNSPIFLERFMEALYYYSSMFDSFEAISNFDQQGFELTLAEKYLGREIRNIIACEGSDRVERHEKLDLWRLRMSSAGFKPLYLRSQAMEQARTLLTLFSGQGHVVAENHGCLTLGWQSRPLIATSTWQCS